MPLGDDAQIMWFASMSNVAAIFRDSDVPPQGVTLVKPQTRTQESRGK